VFLTGIPISGVIGGPVAGWIMQHFHGVNGWRGWQWLFLLEALPAFLAGVVALFYLTDGIRQAKWLSEPEKRVLEEAVKAEAGKKEHHSMKDAFGEPKVWLLAVTYALFLMGLYGVGFRLPSLIKAAFLGGAAAAAGIAFVNSVGNISGFVAPYMVGWIKDRIGSPSPALLVIAASMTLASLLVFRVPRQLVNK